MRRWLALAAVALLAGCGDDGTLAGGSGDRPRLVVSAASSLKAALERCAPAFDAARVRLQFAGSDELAAQIRQGVPVDVFAAANTQLPEALAADGKLEPPVAFATNELVLAVPAGSDVRALADVARPGVKLVIGAEGVPVGDYTRAALQQLGEQRNAAILANVRSNEPDVKGIVGKLTQGAADAGFVYRTDLGPAGADVEAIELPADLDTTATYAAGVVAGTDEPEAAEAFVDDLLAGGCHDALLDAGFGTP